MEQEFKKCPKCREVKLLSQFRKTHKRFGQDILPKQYYKSKCKKFESKAADAIGSHAGRLRRISCVNRAIYLPVRSVEMSLKPMTSADSAASFARSAPRLRQLKRRKG